LASPSDVPAGVSGTHHFAALSQNIAVPKAQHHLPAKANITVSAANNIPFLFAMVML
jgi:hypothetical protein